MAKAKRKTVVLLVTVTAPAGMPLTQIRREVRTLITEQSNYDADPGDVRALSCTPYRAKTEDQQLASPEREADIGSLMRSLKMDRATAERVCDQVQTDSILGEPCRSCGRSGCPDCDWFGVRQ